MGVSKINWIKIKNDYINGRGSYRKLADKYSISATSIGKRARLEGWAEQREKQLHKSYTKVAQKTADRIAEREADRVARLLGTTDKLQDALERAADELDRQMVKSRTRTRETVYGGAQAPESGKPVKETVREEEQIEIAEGLIDRLGLQQLSVAIKNLRDVIVSLDTSEDENNKVTQLLGELTAFARNKEGE